MHSVYPAEPYRPYQMGSFGKAMYMLIRQHQFPNTYDPCDKHITADSDRCFQWDYDHARRCFQQHTGTGEMGLEYWLDSATDEQVLVFLKDILKADEAVEWTGYRILGSVHQGNGYPVWTLELFAKHPESSTEVYTGAQAPNVLNAPRER